MIREIMFRGKRLDNGEWVYGYYAVWGLIQHVIYTPGKFGENNAYEVNQATVGQYTGLTDQNGVKIFEGDFLRNKWGELEGVVEYGNWNCSCCNGVFGFAVNKMGEWMDWIDAFGEFRGFDECEVVGNVWDNPELLKGDDGDGT